MGGGAHPNEQRATAQPSESCSETLRVEFGDDGVGRRKSGPITCTELHPGVWHNEGLERKATALKAEVWGVAMVAEGG